MMDDALDITRDEIIDVLEHIKRIYGYDFLKYSNASIKRRIIRFMSLKGYENAYELKSRLINKPDIFQQFMDEIPVMHTEMFRDAGFYHALKNTIFPYLATYPYPKIWHAACATGEEVYSNAILLSEANLLNRSTIYATDINRIGLNTAQNRMYSKSKLIEFEKNYQHVTGKNNLNLYYNLTERGIIFKPELQKRMVFSFHNLVTDSSFNEFNLVICRNVLIYFNLELQNKVLELIYSSLAPFGFLALGNKESMYGSPLSHKYEVVDIENKIYRKIG